jgi:undecaprenyl diphosphate synthase
MAKAEVATRSKSGLYLTVAINYSAREDIVTATQTIAKAVAANEMEVSDINEQLIQERLSTNIIPESFRQPDLLLRTSGEERLSDFLLWELAYTELFFTTVKWPDFDEQALKEVIEMYSSRERRYGGREGNV